MSSLSDIGANLLIGGRTVGPAQFTDLCKPKPHAGIIFGCEGTRPQVFGKTVLRARQRVLVTYTVHSTPRRIYRPYKRPPLFGLKLKRKV